jgi:hypothetical protein
MVNQRERKDIVDAYIAMATNGLFTGDERDGIAPEITLKNFYDEAIRYGARALRARLFSLSDAELLAETDIALKHVDWRQKDIEAVLARVRQNDREEAARAHRQRQAELARRPRLQHAILAAARHYRALGKDAKEAWRVIKHRPYQIEGKTVSIDGDAAHEIMSVRGQGKQERPGIKFNHWRQRYWPVAAEPG